VCNKNTPFSHISHPKTQEHHLNSSSRLLIVDFYTETHVLRVLQVRQLSFTGHELYLGSATACFKLCRTTLNSVDAFLMPLLCILPCALDWAGIRNPSAGVCR
jgi:hypothetical protein